MTIKSWTSPSCIYDDEKHIIVVCIKTTHCPPCERVRPAIEKLAKYYSNAKFYSLNAEHYPRDIKDWDIVHVPTFIVFKNGKVLGRVDGADANELDRILDKIFSR